MTVPLGSLRSTGASRIFSWSGGSLLASDCRSFLRPPSPEASSPSLPSLPSLPSSPGGGMRGNLGSAFALPSAYPMTYPSAKPLEMPFWKASSTLDVSTSFPSASLTLIFCSRSFFVASGGGGTVIPSSIVSFFPMPASSCATAPATSTAAHRAAQTHALDIFTPDVRPPTTLLSRSKTLHCKSKKSKRNKTKRQSTMSVSLKPSDLSWLDPFGLVLHTPWSPLLLARSFVTRGRPLLLRGSRTIGAPALQGLVARDEKDISGEAPFA
mmetsp:Transcript_4873/g.14566  ORF Transcript_4873/g.14566 Transcript_4873/m.14566 type:complete len:268 (+) Transcript_4873:239-1042(+)